MRLKTGTALAALGMMALAGCGDKAQERQQADARAAGFVPPSVMSRVDFGSMMERRFHTLDRDGDDRITHDELPSPNARIKAFDKNGDGIITATEWSEGALRWFDSMDLNRDGTVTSEERAASRAARSRQQ